MNSVLVKVLGICALSMPGFGFASEQNENPSEYFQDYLKIQDHKPGVIAGMCGAYAVVVKNRPLFFRAHAAADAEGGDAAIDEFTNMANGLSEQAFGYRDAGDLKKFQFNNDFLKCACLHIKAL